MGFGKPKITTAAGDDCSKAEINAQLRNFTSNLLWIRLGFGAYLRSTCISISGCESPCCWRIRSAGDNASSGRSFQVEFARNAVLIAIQSRARSSAAGKHPQKGRNERKVPTRRLLSPRFRHSRVIGFTYSPDARIMAPCRPASQRASSSAGIQGQIP